MNAASDQNTRIDMVMLGLLAAAMAAYLLPWMVAPSAAMTLNAWDLAEWTSLHPAQRAATPGLIAPLLLRIHLLILTTILASIASHRPRMIAATLLFLALAQLPPLEFVNQPGDENYQQMLLLAALTLTLPFLCARWLPRRFQNMSRIGLSLCGAIAAVLGLSQAQWLFQNALQEGEPGAGFGLMLLAYAGIALLAIPRWKRKEAADAASRITG